MGSPGQAPSPDGFLPLALGLVADLSALPFDVYLLVGGQPVLYARRDSDPLGVVARVDRASAPDLVVRSGEGPALRATLLESLRDVVDRSSARASDPDPARRVIGLTAALLEPALIHGSSDPGVDPAALAAAAEAARLAGRAIADRPELAGRVLARRPASIASRRVAGVGAGLVHLERAIDGIALSAALARALGIDPFVAAEATALRDLTLDPAAGQLAGTAIHWQHPLRAADRVLAGGGSMAVALAIAAHHERLDGSGHPAGLTADALGPMERLVALVDVLVAMTHRDAAGGLPIGEAFRALRMAVAGRFDGRTVFALAGLIADGSLGPGRADRA
jgi:HD domain